VSPASKRARAQEEGTPTTEGQSDAMATAAKRRREGTNLLRVKAPKQLNPTQQLKHVLGPGHIGINDAVHRAPTHLVAMVATALNDWQAENKQLKQHLRDHQVRR